jgi:hypothetical protein
VLSVKFGVLRSPGGEILGLDGRPAAVKNALGYTLTRLGTDHVDIYRLGRLEPAVPIEETVGAIAELVEAGYEYSLVSRGIEDEILPTCRQLEIGITAFGVLSRGLISGHWSQDRPVGPATSEAACHASGARISTATSPSSSSRARWQRRGARPSRSRRRLRRDDPAAVLAPAEQRGEARVGIKTREAAPIDRTLTVNERRRLQIGQQRVILNLRVHRFTRHGTCGQSSATARAALNLARGDPRLALGDAGEGGDRGGDEGEADAGAEDEQAGIRSARSWRAGPPRQRGGRSSAGLPTPCRAPRRSRRRAGRARR